MRNRNLYIFLGLIILAALGVLLVVLNKEPRYEWAETFQQEKKQPYDLSLFRTVLEASTKETGYEVLTNIASDTAIVHRKGTSMVFVNSLAFLDSAEAETILKYVANGNTLLISATNQHRIINRLLEQCISKDTPFVKKVKAKRIYPTASVSDTGAVVYYNDVDEVKRYPWTYFDLEYCGENGAINVGQFKAIDRWYTNLVLLKHGDGNVFLHGNPLLFTNYHLRNEAVFDHAETLLGHLGSNTPIIYFTPYEGQTSAQNRPLVTDGPFSFVLAHTPLRWAWYTLLSLTLLFLLTSVWRLQRPIPVISPPPNETLAYLDVVSRMYRKDGLHKHLVNVQYKLLLNHLRNRYRLSVSRIDKDFFREASIRLRLDESVIIEFFAELDRARNNSTLTDADLARIDHRITEFYAKCP